MANYMANRTIIFSIIQDHIIANIHVQPIFGHTALSIPFQTHFKPTHSQIQHGASPSCYIFSVHIVRMSLLLLRTRHTIKS